MKAELDKGQFGPWALVTGASSGIGKEFARQIVASGINVVLVARREALLAELGRAISREFDVQYRALAMDLSQEGFIAHMEISIYAPYAKERFEAARQHSILHPERIVGKPSLIR